MSVRWLPGLPVACLLIPLAPLTPLRSASLHLRQMSHRLLRPIQRPIADRQNLRLPAAGQVHLLAALRIRASHWDRTHRYIRCPARSEHDRHRAIRSRVRVPLHVIPASRQTQANERLCCRCPSTSLAHFHPLTSISMLSVSSFANPENALTRCLGATGKPRASRATVPHTTR